MAWKNRPRHESGFSYYFLNRYGELARQVNKILEEALEIAENGRFTDSLEIIAETQFFIDGGRYDLPQEFNERGEPVNDDADLSVYYNVFYDVLDERINDAKNKIKLIQESRA